MALHTAEPPCCTLAGVHVTVPPLLLTARTSYHGISVNVPTTVTLLLMFVSTQLAPLQPWPDSVPTYPASGWVVHVASPPCSTLAGVHVTLPPVPLVVPVTVYVRFANVALTFTSLVMP